MNHNICTESHLCSLGRWICWFRVSLVGTQRSSTTHCSSGQDPSAPTGTSPLLFEQCCNFLCFGAGKVVTADDDPPLRPLAQTCHFTPLWAPFPSLDLFPWILVENMQIPAFWWSRWSLHKMNAESVTRTLDHWKANRVNEKARANMFAKQHRIKGGRMQTSACHHQYQHQHYQQHLQQQHL